MNKKLSEIRNDVEFEFKNECYNLENKIEHIFKLISLNYENKTLNQSIINECEKLIKDCFLNVLETDKKYSEQIFYYIKQYRELVDLLQSDIEKLERDNDILEDENWVLSERIDELELEIEDLKTNS